MFVNDEREQFKSPRYYEEVASCQVTGITTPAQRVHMHGNVNSVIHVHDHAVTWGQLFENLGWSIGNNYISTPDHVYAAQDNIGAHYVLNGQDVSGLTDVASAVIKDQDRLLVSYGEEDAGRLQQQYKSVPDTAHQYDITQDPSTCAGSEKITFSDRLKHLFK